MRGMVRAGSSAPMLIVSTDRGVALCVFVDGNGIIRERHHHVDQLTPLWLSLSPKTTWPESGNLDLVAIEREEREARASRKASQKAARKARRSNKIRRSDAAE
jgi:hypothetical protein